MRSFLASLFAAFAVLGLVATSVQAQQNTCHAAIQIEYVAGNSPAMPGDTIRVRFILGSGNITGVANPTLTISRIRFDLDCNNPPVVGPVGCTDDGAVIAYNGDASITSTCVAGATPVTWSTGHAVSTSPNQVVFTPDLPLVIPANDPEFCQIEFDITVAGASDDATPNLAEEVMGYDFSQADGQCNNGLSVSSSQSASLQLATSPTTTNTTTTSSTTTTLPPDSDGDGVSDTDESCFCTDTPPVTPVTAAGCSIGETCPCSAPRGRAAWSRHGEYVKCVKGVAGELEAAGAITRTERKAAIRTADDSDCGR